MPYELFYYRDEKGRVPVKDYLDRLNKKDRTKVIAYLAYLVDYGPEARRPFADAMGGKTGLYELRPARNRILYFYFERNKIVLLHAILKKSKSLPVRDIDKALERKEIVKTLGKHHLLGFEEMS